MLQKQQTSVEIAASVEVFLLFSVLRLMETNLEGNTTNITANSHKRFDVKTQHEEPNCGVTVRLENHDANKGNMET